MQRKITLQEITNWIAGIVVFIIGFLNLFLVHPVPALMYFLLSFIYFPVTDEFLFKKFGFRIPVIIKIIFGIVIILFTLGVSDLGEMIDGPGR